MKYYLSIVTTGLDALKVRQIYTDLIELDWPYTPESLASQIKEKMVTVAMGERTCWASHTELSVSHSVFSVPL